MDDVYKRARERYLEKKASSNPDHLLWFMCDYDLIQQDADILEKMASGWIEPDGTFHGVLFGKHCQYAGIVLGKTEFELEELGWVKTCDLRNKVFFAGEVYGHNITAKQAAVIKSKGFSLRDDVEKV